MSRDTQAAQEFQKEPTVTSPPFGDRLVGRILLTVLSVALLGGLLGGLSWLMLRLRTSPPPEGLIVVASCDLKPYERLGVGDVELAGVHSAVEGTVLTDTVPLLNQAIVLQAIDEGEAVTAESVVTFSSTAVLTDTIVLAIPLPPEKTIVSALEPGLPVLLIGTTVSDTVATPVYSTTVFLVDVADAEAVVAIRPEVAMQLSLYLPPRGRVILAPTIDR